MQRFVGTAAIAFAALAGCTTSTETVGPIPPPSTAHCTHPRAILTTSSPLHSALTQWAAQPAGAKSALEALDFACDASREPDALGTERAACTLLALVYSSGEGVKRDPTRAFDYFSRASGCESFGFAAMDSASTALHQLDQELVACCASRGCAPGCDALCAQASQHVERELTPILSRACSAGRGTGCFMLALLYRGEYVAHVGMVKATFGRSEEDTLKESARLIERSCALGLGQSCAWLDKHEQACDAGWAEGCFQKGLAIEAAKGRPAALGWYERGCALGQHRLCDQLGEMFEHGADGIPIDHDRAVKNYANAWR